MGAPSMRENRERRDDLPEQTVQDGPLDVQDEPARGGAGPRGTSHAGQHKLANSHPREKQKTDYAKMSDGAHSDEKHRGPHGVYV